ncbi:oxygenase MpaB family protein [Chondrinema litorale]|uniref:oxygenase MpaB family protein n=1 Tax=Chondrinema litorale TaxID=2994555 RepID=UPI00254346EC|nr:oxygenase MpaB family protein [Chondrinema litorale]UZR95785.1 oxygenase MpaB family protein [Chondrinema litorale]
MQRFAENLLNDMRLVGDELADNAIKGLFEGEVPISFKDIFNNNWRENDAIQENTKEQLSRFFSVSQELPAWADSRKMKKANMFFSEYSGDIMGLLGSLSLPYCYAAADGAKVLAFSERIKKDTQNRLAETGQFVLDVLSPNMFELSGKAVTSIQKVRLIHASIRYHILKSGKWKMEWGLPVNQEDMAGTNLAFSFIILRGLRKSGRVISTENADAFMHIWNVIGFMLGLDEKLIPQNLKAAYDLAQLIERRHMKPSAEGKLLTKALLESYKDLPVKLPNGYLTSYMRYLMGDDIANMLELPQANWTSNLVKLQKLNNTLGQYTSLILNKSAGRKFDKTELEKKQPQFTFPEKLGFD